MAKSPSQIYSNSYKAQQTFTAAVETGEITVNTDFDGDGVIDGWDDCPGTPEGSFVDKNVCSGEAGCSDAELYREGLALCEPGACPPVSDDNCVTYEFIC